MRLKDIKMKQLKPISLILGFALVLPSVLFAKEPGVDREAQRDRYELIFHTLMNQLERSYVEPVDDKELMIGAIRGMLAATGDPYTRFLDTDQHREFSRAEDGRFVGIGIEVTMCNSRPCIITPMDGSPAFKAGILPGDIIMKINGEDTLGLSFADILTKMTGKEGSSVRLGILRSGSEIDFELVRTVFDIEYVRGEIIGKTGYLRLSSFFGEDTGAIEQFQNQLEFFTNKNVKGVVLDLRNNSGGHLEMAATLAGMFLPEGKTVVTARGRTGNPVVYKTKETDFRLKPDLPVVVLVNKGSASASEILAGALQDYKRATIIGTTTFGKASVQTIIRPLPENTAALITVQKYYTPNNRMIHGKGLAPDISVDQPEPNLDERYYFEKLRQSGFFERLTKKYPEYSAAAELEFRRELNKRGFSMRPEIFRTLLRSVFAPSAIPDPDFDFQLKRAMQLIEK